MTKHHIVAPPSDAAKTSDNPQDSGDGIARIGNGLVASAVGPISPSREANYR